MTYCENAYTTRGPARTLLQSVQEDCQPGFIFEKEESVKSGFAHEAVCKKAVFNRSSADCCLNNTGGAGSEECAPGFCVSKQDSTPCQTAIKEYCRNNLGASKEFSAQCWEWAKSNEKNAEIIDEHCNQLGGKMVSLDANCREFAKSSLSHGKMDKAVENYCRTTLSQENREKGENICNCFKSHVEGVLQKTLGDNVQPVCWYTPCTESGYKTASAKERIKKCGDFCAQIISEVGSIEAKGNIDLSMHCKSDAEKFEKTDKTDKNSNNSSNSSSATPSASTDNNTWVYAVIGGVLLLIIIIIVVVVVVITVTKRNTFDNQYFYPYQ